MKSSQRLSSCAGEAAARRRRILSSIFVLIFCSASLSICQVQAQGQNEVPVTDKEELAPGPKEIAVTGVTADAAIERRITRILERSEWFRQVVVDVKEGIVILGGVTSDSAYKRWAEAVASQTEDVVAVVNRIEVVTDWDFSPALDASVDLWRRFIAALPLVALSLIILAFTWLAARLFTRSVASVLERRIESVMLRNIVARLLSLPMVLIGLYLVLTVTGLGQLAVTILGGTGILGLVIGIAFRDITENFLASILISVQRPFRLGDHIKVLEFEGFVQAVTTRGTVIMTLAGNHIQIPNATIYKQPIINYSANPNIAMDFTVGIGYDCSIAHAQDVAKRVLMDHPAVLDTPESLVLTESLGSSTVILKIIFWVNGSEHSVIKVKSAIMRLVKNAFTQHKISMPDEAREVIFPEGVPVLPRQDSIESSSKPQHPGRSPTIDVDDCLASVSEGDLAPDAQEIRRQAEASVYGQNETNIL